MSYNDPNQPPPSGPDWQQPQHTQYPQQQQPQQQTGPGIPPPPQYYPTGGLPPQYPMPPQQPPHLPVWAILLIIAIVALVSAGVFYAAGKSGSTATPTNTTLTGAQLAATNSAQLAATNAVNIADATSTPDTNTNAAHFNVGDTATTPDGFIVTILKVYTSQGDAYDTPKAGNQYLVVDASVKNTTGTVQHMSSGQFTLVDSTGQTIDSTVALLQEIHYFVGGTLQDGATMRGQIVYEVPKGNHPYQLIFMGNMFGNFQTIWDIHS